MPDQGPLLGLETIYWSIDVIANSKPELAAELRRRLGRDGLRLINEDAQLRSIWFLLTLAWLQAEEESGGSAPCLHVFLSFGFLPLPTIFHCRIIGELDALTEARRIWDEISSRARKLGRAELDYQVEVDYEVDEEEG